MTPKNAIAQDKAAADAVWSGIYRRLEDVGLALEKGFAPVAEEKGKILQRRAKALAQESRKTTPAAECLEVVTFRVARERYAVESAWVVEVLRLKHLTSVPCTPSFVLGVTNIRGEILTVIDLRKFFDLPEVGLGELSRVIVLRKDGLEVGLQADAVLGAKTIPLVDLQRDLPTLIGIREEFLKGITGDQLVILDVPRLLTDPRLVVEENVEA